MSSPLSVTKAALEDLLREMRLQAAAPPLRGEDRRLSPLPSGLPAIDRALGGGFPRGQLSEIHGPASSGRTGMALALLSGLTRGGGLAAWVDPADRLDPESARSAGADLSRVLWLRGRELGEALAAVAALLGSGLFELVALDLEGQPERELRRLPGTSWIRLQRAVAETKGALVLLAPHHVACGPGGASLALRPARPGFTGAPGPGRLLRALAGEGLAGRHALQRAAFELRTAH
jgi:hypothetical protein